MFNERRVNRFLAGVSMGGAVFAVGLVSALWLNSPSRAQVADGPVQSASQTVSTCAKDSGGALRCQTLGETHTETQEVKGAVEVRSYDVGGVLSEKRQASVAEGEAYAAFRSGLEAEQKAAADDAAVKDWKGVQAPTDAARLSQCQTSWGLLTVLQRDACLVDLFAITARLLNATDKGLDGDKDISPTSVSSPTVVPTGK